MNKKCKYFRTRKETKKGKIRIYNYCTLLRKEVPFSCYQECDSKEYKEYKPIKKSTNKHSKLERDRFSVFYKDLDKCCVCNSKYQITKHEIFEGSAKRINSMKYGFVLPICLDCHRKHQENLNFTTKWKKKAQKYFEKEYGSREEFIKLFGRSYL